MVRRSRLILLLALIGATAVLSFPADSSALRAVFILLTPNGPTPAVLTLPAGLYPVWRSNDDVTHKVVFANGLCSFEVAPGGYGQCEDLGFSVGEYPYTVDGTAQASIVVVPEGRTVTLAAKSDRVARTGPLTLHGQLVVPILSPPATPAPQPVIVLTRHDRYHAFHRIAVVTARAKPRGWVLLWHLRVRPRARTIYIAEADSQPPEGQFWVRAWSRPLKVLVGR